jgi:hypothetical protein
VLFVLFVSTQSAVAQWHTDNNPLDSLPASKLMMQMREKPVFNWTMRGAELFFNDYIPVVGDSARFEAGPITTLVSHNALEGLRFRLGGATTVRLNRQLFAEGYLAYGLDDEKLKGDLLLEYAFEKKKKYRREYPLHYLRAEYKYDVNPIGQLYVDRSYDNVFSLLKRKSDRLLTYTQTAELSYFQEYSNGWSYGIAARHQTEWATEYVPFNEIQSDGSIVPLDHYRTSEIEFKLRWARNEKFRFSRRRRYSLMNATVIELTNTVALKNVLGSDYQYNSTELSVHKRLELSAFGFVNIHGRAGQIWGDVPYPLLFMPRTSLAYALAGSEAFALLDPMEFMSDRFVSWNVQYHLNGLLFNRLPLFNQLKWHEVAALQIWHGDLSDKNNPQAVIPTQAIVIPAQAGTTTTNALFLFPEKTYRMGSTPYMELSFGIEHIFKFLRVDYVRRLTFRNHPGTPNDGVRMSTVFSF